MRAGKVLSGALLECTAGGEVARKLVRGNVVGRGCALGADNWAAGAGCGAAMVVVARAARGAVILEVARRGVDTLGGACRAVSGGRVGAAGREVLCVAGKVAGGAAATAPANGVCNRSGAVSLGRVTIRKVDSFETTGAGARDANRGCCCCAAGFGTGFFCGCGNRARVPRGGSVFGVSGLGTSGLGTSGLGTGAFGGSVGGRGCLAMLPGAVEGASVGSGLGVCEARGRPLFLRRGDLRRDFVGVFAAGVFGFAGAAVLRGAAC